MVEGGLGVREQKAKKRICRLGPASVARIVLIILVETKEKNLFPQFFIYFSARPTFITHFLRSFSAVLHQNIKKNLTGRRREIELGGNGKLKKAQCCRLVQHPFSLRIQPVRIMNGVESAFKFSALTHRITALRRFKILDYISLRIPDGGSCWLLVHASSASSFSLYVCLANSFYRSLVQLIHFAHFSPFAGQRSLIFGKKKLKKKKKCKKTARSCHPEDAPCVILFECGADLFLLVSVHAVSYPSPLLPPRNETCSNRQRDCSRTCIGSTKK